MLTNCPNCDAVVTTRTVECPGCRGPLRQRPVDASRAVLLWCFLAFNVFMAGWTAFYSVTGRVTLRAPSVHEPELAVAGLPLGGNLGLGFIIGLWLLGLLLLGICASFSHFHGTGRAAASLRRAPR